MGQDTTEGEYLIPCQKLLTNVEKMGFHVKRETNNTYSSTHIVIYQEKSAHMICDIFSLC